MVRHFRRRDVAAAVAAGVAAIVGIFVLRSDARYLFDELTSKALPLVLIVVRGLTLLCVHDQKSLLPDEGVD